MSSEYDPENIFAKIIDGKIPSFKVFESKATLAILDAFPYAEGHTLVLPKLKGYTQMIDMPPAKASEFLRDLTVVAKAVKEATGATGVNIFQNNGKDAGQSVFHPHFHIIPRKEGDNLFKYPESGAKLTQEVADPILKKLESALNPPKSLKKAKFFKISNINPDSRGLNLNIKVIGPLTEASTKGGKFWEVLVADPSGSVILSLRDTQKDLAKPDSVITVRNASVKMVAGHIRVAVDKWGKIEESSDPIEEEVNSSDKKNISLTEYELVGH